ncbi:MAG TPA: serine hydrolase [Gallionellaceae bacterium]|nr:serine hydrolase [Gallionellaceae bacterium]
MHYLLIGLLLVCNMALGQPDPFPKVAASYLVQLNGKPLWEKQANRRLPPASLTKLMTVLLVLDDYHPHEVVQISHLAAQETGTRLGVRNGQRFHVEDLLAAALLNSDNDACHALADHVAGSQERFVQMMNRRAQQLDMRNTHFANACGHDADHHYSSAHDLALLANALLKIPLATQLAAQASTQFSALDDQTIYQVENKNALIGRYPGALGLKTGYTPKAGKCLVAYARRGGDEVLLVMLNAPDRWWDAVDILDMAFARARQAL